MSMLIETRDPQAETTDRIGHRFGPFLPPNG